MKFHDCAIPITNYCNSRCEFCCIIGKTNNKKREKYIPISRAKEFIKNAFELGSKRIVFTGGGEPTTRFNELIKLMKFSKSMNMEIHLITNASYAKTKKEAENKTSKMFAAGLDRIIFSFDHDHLCHIPFKTYLKAIKPALKYDKLKIQICCIDKKSTREKNTKYMKKLAKTLSGKFKIPLFQERIKSLFDYEINYIYLKNKKITVLRFHIEYFGSAKSLKHEFDFYENKKVVFDPASCSDQRARNNLTICYNFDEKIGVVCPYLVNNFLYKRDNFKKDLNRKLYLFKEISSIFGFIKLYLSIINLELKTGKNFLKKKYPHKCNLCEDILKIIKNQKLNKPSKIQTFFFILAHLSLFLKISFHYLLFISFFRIRDKLTRTRCYLKEYFFRS